MKIFLAHGVLGIFDELIYLTPGLFFFAALCLTWLRTLNARQQMASRMDDKLHSQPTDEGETLIV